MITMFKSLAVLGIFSSAVALTGQSARADHVSVGFGVSVGSARPVYVAPPVVYRPAPVVTYYSTPTYYAPTYYAPTYTTSYYAPPVVYAPAPVVYSSPSYYYSSPAYYSTPYYSPGILDFSFSILGGGGHYGGGYGGHGGGGHGGGHH